MPVHKVSDYKDVVQIASTVKAPDEPKIEGDSAAEAKAKVIVAEVEPKSAAGKKVETSGVKAETKG